MRIFITVMVMAATWLVIIPIFNQVWRHVPAIPGVSISATAAGFIVVGVLGLVAWNKTRA